MSLLLYLVRKMMSTIFYIENCEIYTDFHFGREMFFLSQFSSIHDTKTFRFSLTHLTGLLLVHQRFDTAAQILQHNRYYVVKL